MRIFLPFTITVTVAVCLAGPRAAMLSRQGPASAPREPAAIVLPQRIVTGQTATLAVLDDEGRLLPGVEVEFSGAQRLTTDATGRAIFTAPGEPGVLLVQLAAIPGVTQINPQRHGLPRGSTTVIPPPGRAGDGVQVNELPHLVSVQDRFGIEGWGFQGRADANHVTLSDRPAVVLAASPVELVVAPGPGAVPGPAELLVEVGGRSPGPIPLTLIALEISAAKSKLAPREEARLEVRVRGSEQPVEIELRNLTPDVVRLIAGDPLRLTTRGGLENTAGTGLEGLRAGEFAVSARLVRGAAGLPNLDAARRELRAALQRAPGAWKGRVSRLIEHLDEHPEHALDVRNELEKMLADQPEGEFGRRLEAAWKILLNR